jgi:drug/metabolite transporter (DMT)-like permease
MIRGITVFIVAMFSIIVLKKKYARHHWTGLALILLGISIVAYGGLVSAEKKQIIDGTTNKETTPFGLFILVLAQFFMAFCVIAEEILFSKYKCNALKLTGLEGVFGSLNYFSVLFILQFIPCPRIDYSFCDVGDVLVNTIASFEILFTNGIVFTMMFGFVICVSIYKLSSVYLVKCSTATN